MPEPQLDEGLEISGLAARRQQTEAIARVVRQRLEQHLEVLRPAFDPRRLLGRHAEAGGGRSDVAGSDAALAGLRERFAQLSGTPFSLRSDLPPEAISAIDHRLELQPWEYLHEARGRREAKTLRVTSPLRWALSYSSGYTLPQLRRAFAGEEERRDPDVRQFVVNALVMRAMVEKFAPLRQILSELRFDVSIETLDGFGKLPFVLVASHVRSLRPSDEMILEVTDLSGVGEFIEVVGADPLANLRDPLREEIERVLGK